VLLLEYVEEDGRKQRKCYLLSDLAQSVSDAPPSAREWIISVLTDISHAQFDPHLSTEEMFSWYSYLDVAPLRTTCSGSIVCTSLSEAFASIKDSVMSEGWSETKGGCFPDLLLPLDHVTLSSIRTQQKCHSPLRKSKRVIFPTGFVVSYGVMMRPWNVGKL